MPHSPYIPQRLRRLVAARARFRCEYCQLQQTLCPESFELDHVIPRALGGKTATKRVAEFVRTPN